MARRLITRDDVIRGGLCADGVYAWAEKHAPLKTALPISLVLRVSTAGEKASILRAIALDGDGSGYGFGDGYEYGDGGGDGFGDGGI